MLGHPECMIHPMKHEMRLSMHNGARIPIHQVYFFSSNSIAFVWLDLRHFVDLQLLLMKKVALFVNDPIEALRTLLQFPSKASSCKSFRYDEDVPDVLTANGSDWQLRHEALAPAFSELAQCGPESASKVDVCVERLQHVLQQAQEASSVLDMRRIWSLFALDVICWTAFAYDLNGLGGSALGADVYDSLDILAASQQQEGLYSFPNVRQVTKDDISRAQSTWKVFLQTLFDTVLCMGGDNDDDDSSSGLPQSSVARQLSQLHSKHKQAASSDTAAEPAKTSVYGDAELRNDIHQLVRHGYESLAGTLMWTTYVLYRHRKVRHQLETSLRNASDEKDGEGGEYLECFLKEILRRYPAAGNMTIRCAEATGQDVAGVDIPVDVPVHVHIFSLHNSVHLWDRPKDFWPERWLAAASSANPDSDGDATATATLPSRPTCPFARTASPAAALTVNHQDNYEDYHGTGFEPDSVAFLPFSVSDRRCPASIFALRVLRRTLRAIVPRFRLNVAEERVMMEDDIGGSWSATLWPWAHETMLIRVQPARTSSEPSVQQDSDGGKRPAQDDGNDDDDGWAKDE
jgi:hypothetical protein